ncbi:unnamed protein product [Caenorhabditis angaria]|uniref:ZP domain-containing protein n=1 Tax=Caenorhabditis angaria TaxID=860376 RepID=A0A9P1I2D0_9PELO|nr:unnamed protein product [Caenorhabditis angaria]
MKGGKNFNFQGWPSANTISIDNEIIGEPDIECLEDEIRIWIKTRKIFAGRIYAKGRSELEDCYKDDFATQRTKKPHFDLQFGACGMKSLRSVDPRGMYYGITVVVSFHPLFITKVDQAYHVKCFFEEANKGLTAELGVSMIPTSELEARHGIPGCSYSIHSSSIDDLDAGRPAGQPIQFARVGDRVVHQWHCNDQMYGVLINNCYVTDGFGKKADVIDDKGCPINPILITGIRYSSDLQRAYAESSVFKFADKPGVWFFCQVQMCMKKHGMCDGITPPSCGSMSKVIDSFETDETPHRRLSTPNPDYEYVDEQTSTTKKQRGNRIRTTTKPSNDYEYEGDEAPKLHSPNSNSYNGAVTQPLDYDSSNPVTAFSPPINPVTPTQESVSKTFETEDDLLSSSSNNLSPTTTIEPPKSKKISKSGDYNDYDEVTIPPNLTDLLANLPDDISSDSLQKMLRDSVDDPKALLAEFDKMMKKKNKKKTRNMRDLKKSGDFRSGEKIDQIEVDWTSTRRRDIPAEDENELRGKNEEKPMIAGQLLIYDLDEEMPNELKENGNEKANSPSTCSPPISKAALMIIFAFIGALLAILIAIIMGLFIRLKYPSTSSDNSSCSSSSVFPFAQQTQKRYFFESTTSPDASN